MNQDSTTPVTEADETAPADAANDAAEVKAAYTPEVTVLLARIEEYKDGWQRERNERIDPEALNDRIERSCYRR